MIDSFVIDAQAKLSHFEKISMYAHIYGDSSKEFFTMTTTITNLLKDLIKVTK